MLILQSWSGVHALITGHSLTPSFTQLYPFEVYTSDLNLFLVFVVVSDLALNGLSRRRFDHVEDAVISGLLI